MDLTTSAVGMMQIAKNTKNRGGVEITISAQERNPLEKTTKMNKEPTYKTVIYDSSRADPNLEADRGGLRLRSEAKRRNKGTRHNS